MVSLPCSSRPFSKRYSMQNRLATCLFNQKPVCCLKGHCLMDWKLLQCIVPTSNTANGTTLSRIALAPAGARQPTGVCQHDASIAEIRQETR